MLHPQEPTMRLVERAVMTRIAVASPRRSRFAGRSILRYAPVFRSALLVGALAALPALPAPATAQSPGPTHLGYDPTVSAASHYHEGELGAKLMLVERALKCNCSCGMDVHSCQYQMQCEVSSGWTQRIMAGLEQGQTVEAIQAGFVAEFGPVVLMAPPAEGFNLVGYLLPAIAIVTAGMLIGLLVRGGTHREAVAHAGRVSLNDEERLRDAMKELDEAESPDW
jgi:cytochrome c-type biogenesis protein CcmH/NrfF